MNVLNHNILIHVIVENHKMISSSKCDDQMIQQQTMIQICRMVDLCLHILNDFNIFETYPKQCVYAMCLLKRICDKNTWGVADNE